MRFNCFFNDFLVQQNLCGMSRLEVGIQLIRADILLGVAIGLAMAHERWIAVLFSDPLSIQLYNLNTPAYHVLNLQKFLPFYKADSE